MRKSELRGAVAKGDTYPLRTIRDLKKISILYPREVPKSGTVYYWDEEIVGLSVRPLKPIDKADPSKGRRYRFYFYTRDSGGPVNISLGSEIQTYDQAKLRAMDIMSKTSAHRTLGANVDLIADRKAERAVKRGEHTFEALTRLYNEKRTGAHRDGGKEARRIGAQLCKLWGDRDAASIDRPLVQKFLTAMIDAGKKPRSIKSYIKVLYDFAAEPATADKPIHINIANPATGYKLLGSTGRKIAGAAHYRALDDGEIKTVLEALGDRTDDFADLLRVVLLSGQRPWMLAGAKWSEVSWAKDETGISTIKIPWERVKSAREEAPHDHILPLVGETLRIIRRRFDLVGRDTNYIFPSMGHNRDTFSTILKREMRNLRPVAALSAPWHFYGLRASFADGVKGLGMGDTETRKDIMDHTNGAVEAAYTTQKIKNMAVVLTRWDRHVAEVLKGKQPATVHDIESYRRPAVEA